jgi:hypothetical protein
MHACRHNSTLDEQHVMGFRAVCTPLGFCQAWAAGSTWCNSDCVIRSVGFYCALSLRCARLGDMTGMF